MAEWYLQTEEERKATPIALEQSGSLYLADVDFRLTAKADRIDRLADGRVAVLDYKTGDPPSKNQMELFDRQLLLEALIAEEGGFQDLPPEAVGYVAYYKLGANAFYQAHALEDTFSTDRTRHELETLIRQFDRRERGYTARRAAERVSYEGDYDHLSRHGEWDISDLPLPQDVE